MLLRGLGCGFQASTQRGPKMRLRLRLRWGISVELNLEELESEIRRRSRERDKLAYGVWLKSDGDEIALRVTEGQFKTEAGIHDKAFLPEPQILPDDYFDRTRRDVLSTALKQESAGGRGSSALIIAK